MVLLSTVKIIFRIVLTFILKYGSMIESADERGATANQKALHHKGVGKFGRSRLSWTQEIGGSNPPTLIKYLRFGRNPQDSI